MKFYVKSLDLDVCIAGPHIESAEDAAKEAVLRHFKEGVALSPLTIVSERGSDWHSHDHSEDAIFFTSEILLRAGYELEEE